MYYVVYGLLYAVSLLPLRVLFLLSSAAYFILYYITGYRKKVVLDNLAIAFPEKTAKERKKIAKQFYLNFTDSFIESIKAISISRKELEKRALTDFRCLDELIEKGKSINLMAAHQFNWEFANLVCGLKLKTNFVGIYQPIGSKIFNRIFYKSRQRFGTILVSTREFKSRMHRIFNEQYVLALAADQNPTNKPNAFWMQFFGKPVPFIPGPAKGAVKNNLGVVFVVFRKIKRGYYSFDASLIAENASACTPEQLTMMYRDVVMDTVLKDPANYLWSHRRWRHEWKKGYNPVLD